MAVLMVPPLDEPGREFPSLGPQVVEWMESFLVHGPGDVRGEPYRLDDEKRAIVWRLYEVYPQGHPLAGRRRFKRAGVSVRKGWAKTELGAALAAAELHPDAPVRCDGFDAHGQPVGVGVVDPYVPMIAFTAEQSEELAFGALVVMLSEGPLADDFDLGLGDARSGVVTVIGPHGRAAGRAAALAAAPNARDGARTTFQLFDETHRQHSDRLRHAHQTMLQNLPKRRAADAWSLEVTTAYEPGQDSIAERTMGYARQVAAGRLDEPSLFFYHRYADDRHDLATREGRAAAVLEASGPAAAFTDVDYVVGISYDPDVDLTYWERVWLNRVTASSRQFFPVARWDELGPRVEPDEPLWLPEPGRLVTLGFDGSRTRDSTGWVVTDLELRRQAVLGHWEVPRTADGRPVDGWEVPVAEVEAVLDDALARWDVVLAYCDPYWWESELSRWIGRAGTRRVGGRRMHRIVEWHTNRPRPMAQALRAFVGSIRAGELSHSGDPRLRRHLAHAVRADTNLRDPDGHPLPVIRKERADSPNLIDLAMCACLSWEAARDAMALSVRRRSKVIQVY